MRPSSGWTLTSLPRSRSSRRSRRRWRASATPSSPSCTPVPGARECLTWAVCPVACLEQEAPPLEVDPELDPPSRRSTKCIPSTSRSIVLNNPFMKPYVKLHLFVRHFHHHI